MKDNFKIWIFLAVFSSLDLMALGQGVTGDSLAIQGLKTSAEGRHPVIDTSKDSGGTDAHASREKQDTLPSLIASDSGQARTSESARMYQSTYSGMRRDAPRQTDAIDTRTEKADSAAAATAVGANPDSISPKESREASGSPVKIKKTGIILAVGSCAIIGCGIVAYLLANSKNDETVSQNNRIPPPPDPPVK
jgi:hypothetical protein